MGDPLTLPTDRVILNLMSDGNRQTPKNVAAILDQDRSYMSGRLRALEDRGYLHDPGPADRSGMYEITERGQVAAEHIDRYVREYDDVFERLVDRILENQPDDEFIPDLLVLEGDEFGALRVVSDTEGLAIHSNVAETARDQYDMELSPDAVTEELYKLYFFGLLDRKEGMDVYEINRRGAVVRNHEVDAVLDDPIGITKQLREAEETNIL